MRARIILIILATAGAMSSASAADLGGMPPADCDCGSNMITIYDTEPGVVTRRWWADCDCNTAPAARRALNVAAQRVLPEFEPLIEPWRRN